MKKLTDGGGVVGGSVWLSVGGGVVGLSLGALEGMEVGFDERKRRMFV